MATTSKILKITTTNKVSATYTTGMAFKHNINSHEFFTDTSAADGGADEGPGPKRLMLSSLAGCTGFDVVSILNKMRVEFSRFSIEIEAELTEDEPRTYNKVIVTYRIELNEDQQEKMVKAVNLSVEKYCGVMAMFKKFAEVQTKIEYLI